MRKHGLLVNDGDKSTKEELEEKKKINQEKYGLSPEAVQAIKLTEPTAVCFYDVKKIMKAIQKVTFVIVAFSD